jgi:hypothetical protein
VLGFHAQQIDTVLGCLSPSEQGQLQVLLGRLSQHLEGLLARGAGASIG